MDSPSYSHATRHDQDRLSPVFADSAIDMDIAPPPPTQVSDDETAPETEARSIRLGLTDRLVDLARRTTTAGTRDTWFSKDDTLTLQRCLDTIENTLLLDEEEEEEEVNDPRPGLTQEITKYRPEVKSASLSPSETQTPQPPLTSDCPPNNDGARSAEHQHQQQFNALLEEVTALGYELHERRNESFYIYDLFTLKTQQLERRTSGLEDEVRELHTDILENSIEREGLRGTVHGLESWVDGWQQDHERVMTTRQTKTLKAQKKRWTKRRPDDYEYIDSEALALSEGITAWMRGWKDVEEEFRSREWKRELRREERIKQRLDANAIAYANVDEKQQTASVNSTIPSAE